MIILRKSILRKVFEYYLIFILFSGVIVAGFYWTKMPVTMPVLILILCFFGLYFLWLFWHEILHPLKTILNEMKAILTGRPYKKILTGRIDEIGLIAHFFNEVTKNFEKVTTQIEEGKRMTSELEIASHIQKEILPPEIPQIPGLDIVAKTRAAVELGGDNFDFITEKDNTFIYIGDVTGHGVPAALVMIMVHTLIHTFVEIYEKAYDVVFQTNRRLKTRIKSTMFMTMLMLRWNQTTEKMSYVGAGHEHLLVYRFSKGECEIKTSGGIALGMVPDNSKIIKEIDLPLAKGDIIILYTDGITEARNTAGEMFGLERLKKAVEAYAPQYAAEGLIHHIARDFSRFVQNHVQEDDITLIAIKYTGEKNTESSLDKKSTSWREAEAENEKS